MNLDDRKQQLKTILALECDTEMLVSLKAWHYELDELFLASGDVGDEDSQTLIKKYFAYLHNDRERLQKLVHVLVLLGTFVEAIVEMDGVSIPEAGKHIQEILDSLGCL